MYFKPTKNLFDHVDEGIITELLFFLQAEPVQVYQ